MRKKLKTIMTMLLVVGLLVTGLSFNLPSVQASDKNPELTALKQNFETNGLLYVTQKNVPASAQFNFNQKDFEVKSSTLDPKSIEQLDTQKFKNIIVDAADLNNNVLTKIRESYNNGTRIVIRKDNISLGEAYNYLGESLDQQSKDGTSDKLTTVAVSMFKDINGQVHAAKINVENNTDAEVTRAIAISFKDDIDPLKHLNSKKKEAFIQTIKPAYANLGTSWPYVNSTSSYDSWTSVDVSYALNVYRNPYNPSNGKYYVMEETPLTVTPRSGYYSGHVYIYHSSSESGTVNYYAPQAQTNVSSISVSFGAPPTTSLNFNIGTKNNINISSGGLGYGYIQWDFYPVGILGTMEPTKYQTYYEPTSQYYQSGSYFYQGMYYSVDMYKEVPPVFYYYGTASHSGIYTGGY